MKRMAAVVCVLAVAGMARAEDKPNPTGTWKYTADVNGQSIDVTIKLKLDGDKLTGTVSVLDTDIKIEDAKYKQEEDVSGTSGEKATASRANVTVRRGARQIDHRVAEAAAPVQRGGTEHFVVSYDSALGEEGVALADAILARCEADYATLRA